MRKLSKCAETFVRFANYIDIEMCPQIWPCRRMKICFEVVSESMRKPNWLQAATKSLYIIVVSNLVEHSIPYCLACVLLLNVHCRSGSQKEEKLPWQTCSDQNAVRCAFAWVCVSACLLNEMKCKTWKWAISRSALTLLLCFVFCVCFDWV